MSNKKVPKFKSADEAGRFWDTHSFVDYEGEFEIEDVEYESKRHVLSVRFDAGDAVEIARKARRLGMDRSTFVRYIVKQHLNHDTDQEAATQL